MKTYPLLQSQLGVLLQSIQHPESTQYNLPNYIFMPLSMTRERIVGAVQKLVESFPELHTRFVVGEQGEMRQWSDMSMPIPVVTRKCSEEELQAYLREGFIRPFDLFGIEPLFRVEVIETEERLCLLSDGHHAIVDGMSFAPILTMAFAKIFEGGSIEPQLYGLYQAAEDEAAAFATEAYQRAKDYYAKKFAGLEMATLSHSPYGTMGTMGRHTATVSRQACDDWCREHGVQVNLLFQAAFSHVLSVLTLQQQVVYAAINHGRMDKRLRNSIGMFVKSVPILVNADPTLRVVDFVKSLRGELMSTIRYGIYPFTHFCSDLGMKPGIIFNFMALTDMEEYVMLSAGNMSAVQPVRKEIDSDISVDIYLRGDNYEIRVQSSLAMNDAATLQRVAEAIRVAVCNMMSHPELTLGELDIVSDEEREALVQLGTGGHLDIDPQMTFVKAFEQRASLQPDRLAVADATDSLTYGELSRRSDILAHRLIACGVKPGDFVAVMLDRTIAFPLAVIAIHKAGAAYVPIDLGYPEERKQYMLEHSQAKLVVDSQFMAESDFAVGGETVAPIDLSTPEALAYMIYTSGSTGRPKGVMIRQSCLWNFIQNFSHVTRMTVDDRVAAHRSFSFDAHLKDLYSVLTKGGSLHIMPEHIRRDLYAIRQFIIDNQITVAGFTTTLGMLVLDTFDDLPIRLLNIGGERLHDVYSDHIVIVNCYGPTECTDDFFFHRIEPGERLHNVPIGRPVSNGHCFLVDTQGRLVPRGAVGELCFAGVQVASGYWRQPELTAEKFTDCPFFAEQSGRAERIHHPSSITPLKMYHTGDLCRWNADGLMEYVGRKDDQVKLRGFRIEFGEVESRAAHFDGISQAVAVVKEVAGSDTLCLYYTSDDPNTTVNADELRRFMAQTLADYMVPAAYMQLETLPLTPSGKVDRRRLPVPSLLQEDVVAPASELEQQLFDIVVRQLGTEAFGVTTDLVTIGMSSLDAMRLSLTISQQTGLQVSVSELLEHPTIRYMAELAHRAQIDADTDLAAFHREQDSYPLTENQRGIYIDWELNRDTTQYNVPVAICLGQQDADGLAEALQQVVDAHSYIKTRLARHEGNVVQLRRDNAPVQVSVTRLDSEPGSEFFQQRVQPFDLFNDDLYRLEIYTYGGRTWLFRDIHHIVSDGLSSAIFFRDMLAACQGTKPQAETVTAFDFALYEQQLSSTSRYDEARDYFDGLLAGTEVASYPRSSNGSKHESQTVTASINDSEAVRKACRCIGITPNSYFQTVVAQVLHSVTRQQRLMLATVSNGRSLAQTQNIVGMFVKTLPMVSEIASDGTTFASAAQSMHRQSIENSSRDFYPLTEMVERHGLRPEILYVFESGIYDNVAAPFSPDADVIVPRLDRQKLPIEVMVNTDQEGNYTIQLNYDAALYSRSSMEALAGALTAYAAHAVQDGILLSHIELTTSDERAALVELGAGKHLDVNPQTTFVKAFEACASKNPDCLAVADATDSLTYGELSRRSDVLAHRLIERGVKPGDFVAIMLDRTIDFPLAVIAIHKAGAAYVPIDLEYPEERQQYMLSDCRATVVVDSQFIADADFAVGGSPADAIDLSSPDGLAYMIYTSGSTGRPKGAMIHQAGLWNFINAVIDMEHLTADDRISAHRSFSFDAHIEDMFPVLTIGGSVHIMPESIRLDLAAIRDFLFEHRITGGGYATPIATLLLNTYKDLPVRFMTAGGEKLAGVYSDHIEIITVYGPTECTDDTSYYSIQPGCRVSNIPIGQTIANCHHFIIDTEGRLVPRGAEGELCFAGVQVGNGYWQQPELTAEKFIPCPFLSPANYQLSIVHCQLPKMYRTGDLCRWNEEGLLEFIDRIDSQVKLRGYRIELGEIESCASKFEGISQTVAVIRPIGGTDTLCLYYTADQGATVDAIELRQFLSRTLTEYMLPAVYMQTDELPLTPNGKIDRRRLPEPTIAAQKEYVAPANKTEEVIARLLGNVLSWHNPVSMLDNFFSMGGDSIKLIHLVSLLYNEGYTAQVSVLMGCNTVRDMARTLVSSSDGPAIAQEPVTGTITPSAFQRRFLSWQLAQPGRFVQSMVLRTSKSIDPELLQQALQALAVHHDMLRATVVGSSIVIRPTTDEHLFALDEDTPKPIDLEHGPILRVVLQHAADGDRLLMVCHHIAVDGVSWRILADDLHTAMTQLEQGQAIVLPKKTHSFAYWTDTVSRYRDSYQLLAEKPYWQQVQERMESMKLTTTGSMQTRHLTVTFEGEPLKQLLTQSAKAYNTEINDLLLTALSQSYYRLTGNNALTIQMEGHGREPLHEPVVTNRTVGWFTSFYPVIILGISGDIRHDVRNVKELLRTVPNKGIGYSILQYMESHEGDTMLRTDLTPLVGFNYLGEAKTMDHGQWTMDHGQVPLPSVDINCGVVDGRFVARFQYDTACWTDEKAQQLADGFVDSLAQVAEHTAHITETEPTASDFGAIGWTEQQFQTVVSHFADRDETLQRVYPLTPMQEGMLITYLSDRDTTAYRLLFRLSVSTLPTEGVLRHTLDYLAAKHEVLRTAILYDGVPQPCQAIVSRQLGLEMLDLTSESDIDAAAARLHQEQLHRPFSLTDDPLFRLVCMKTGDNSCQLLIFMHHIIIDGWCLPIIFSDFLKKMEAEVDGRPLSPLSSLLSPLSSHPYETFVRQLLRRDCKAGLAYWKNLLADYDTRAAIPSYEKPSGIEARPFIRQTLSKTLTTELRQLAAKTGVTLNTVMELGWGLLLQSFCRTDDVVFLRVVSGRDNSESDNSRLIGLFINSVPVRVHTIGTEIVAQSLQAHQEQAVQSAAYDYCPLSEILSQSELGSSLFQSVMAFENYPIDDLWAANPKWDIQPVQIEEEAFGELSIAISPEREGTLRLTFTYDTSLYGEQQMRQIADTFETIVTNMATMSERPISQLPLMTEEAQAALVELGRGERLDFDQSDTLVSLFRQQAAATPDATAVVFGDRRMTYREIDEMTDRIATHLICKYKVQPEEAVGVMIDRSELMVVYPLAIMKAGAAYMPLDFHFPAERLQFMCDDAGVRLILTDEQRVSEGMPDFRGEVWTIDNDQLPIHNSILSIAPNQLAVILYTSGSTGKPKGVALEHHGIVNFCHWYVKEFRMTAADHALGYANFGFDAHMMDIYPALTVGASVYIISSEMRMDVMAMNRYMEANAINIAFMTTQVGTMFATVVGNKSLRLLSTGGEKLMPLKKPTFDFYNGYGPTECTIYSTFYKITSDYDSSLIGRPLDNYQLYVVDTNLRLIPKGAAGELVVAGEGVGRGYLHPSENDADKFTTLFGERCYRTGDLVRWSDDNIEFLGRIDGQVKLRGLRIEMGEIETRASRYEGIRQVVAAVTKIGGAENLCMYYTVSDGCAVDRDALKVFLAETLTDYMVPTAYVQMDEMPLTPNGKVDRRRLPAVDDSLLHADYVAPESELEKLIVSGFEEVLNQERISVNDDFVRLGGDSLDALKLVFSLGERGITVADVLSLRTPAAIARNAKRMTVNLDQYTIESGCPLNNSQMFIYTDIVKFGKYDSYLVPLVVPIDRKYSDEQIRRALDVMFAAHPVLTMHVALRDGVPYMERGDKPAVMKGSLNPLKILRLLTSGFDLYRSLSRHVIVRIVGRCYLVSVVHHLIFDAVSINVFCRHFQRALEGESLGFVDDHFLKVSAFHQEVKTTEQYAETDKYIRAMLSNLSEANFYRNVGKHGRPGYHKRELGIDREQVNRFTSHFGINKNILFTAAMAMTMSKLAGSDDVAFGFLDNGRDRFNNFEDIGLYINGMPIVTHVNHHDMQAFLDHLSDVYYKLSQNAFFPFASLVQEFNIAPIILFQFFPDWITEDGIHNHLPQNETLVNAVLSTQKDFMVEALVDVVETGNSYSIRIAYSGYYSRKMMKALAKTYHETIQQMLRIED